MLPVILDLVTALKITILLGLFYKIYFHFCLNKKRTNTKRADSNDQEYPLVCIQLPLYNEPEHAVELIECICTMDWPKDRLEIQILDDSTDQTTSLIEQSLSCLRSTNAGLCLKHIRRSSRDGYKAGALAFGMSQSNADFFAVFDCDFRPTPDFLKKMMPSFAKVQVAAVQAVWSYHRENKTLLNDLQKRLLDHHFLVEQNARYHSHLPLNFNGTAGIWRRQAIEDVGGWSAITVTEDLYLSYLVQMAGWEIELRDDVSCLSELPTDLASFLVQQRRWALGNGQVLAVLRKKIKSSSWSARQKFDVFIHLTGYATGFFTALLYLLLPVWVFYRHDWLASSSVWDWRRVLDAGLWISLVALFFRVYGHPLLTSGLRPIPKWTSTAKMLLVAPCLSILLLPSYLKGLELGKKGLITEFNRTPKDKRKRSFESLDRVFFTGLMLIFGSTFVVSLFTEQYFIMVLMLLHIVYCKNLFVNVKPKQVNKRNLYRLDLDLNEEFSR